MARTEIPLTDEQRIFAEEPKHLRLIKSYLASRHLPEDEFYDVVVFGYLHAVQRYLTEETLRQYAFSTIAFRAMDSKFSGYIRARECPSRKAVVVPLNERNERAAYGRSPEDNLIDLDAVRRLHSTLTPEQEKIITLSAAGYSRREVGRTCGKSVCDVNATMAAVRDNIVRFAPELLERAA